MSWQGGQRMGNGHRDGHGAVGRRAPQQAVSVPISSASASSGRVGAGVCIGVLGGFGLWVDGESAAVPAGSERVLAFLALCARAAVPRPLIAGTLWPASSEHSAHANLRSALARLHHAGRQALEIGPAEVRLARDTTVDLHDARRTAHRILDPADSGRPPCSSALDAVDVLSADLLPGWYDDWALLEAEDWRQLRLHALETLAGRLITARRYAEAVAAAQAAVHADPLRESGQACLVRAHLAEGNPSEALHAFARYTRRLHDELGLEPTERIQRLVAGLVRSRRGDDRPGP
ncbi:AfsR/SARP family transcriptional regulator [Streptomyces lancefieldiae]|uniref:BTAD domain-containing putative transcriptional regulator n=1 Tax=Streptomyces lancefieldiae TaxID=3075520 RepID=A0ABU3AJT7_9ACTN|nr:BTAD domain-containing putative transcriptional regulator [Streptomyces sp. DSM 40712]MDT0610450.1 BTAD domain-containing putative transcriptional regulator [Streptomyces sp. DSM 40712]